MSFWLFMASSLQHHSPDESFYTNNTFTFKFEWGYSKLSMRITTSESIGSAVT
jgi:hypothetical protein